MNVLVIPEDFRKDQYILKPIIEAMFKNLGKGAARIKVCQKPLLGGIDQALKWQRIEEILKLYKGMVDIFLLIVDRDGQEERKSVLDTIEKKAQGFFPNIFSFFAENAWQEVEVWALAGQKLPKEWNWKGIRKEKNPKETYFEPFAKKRKLSEEPGGGRKTISEEASKNYRKKKRFCPEDVAALEKKIEKRCKC